MSASKRVFFVKILPTFGLRITWLFNAPVITMSLSCFYLLPSWLYYKSKKPATYTEVKKKDILSTYDYDHRNKQCTRVYFLQAVLVRNHPWRPVAGTEGHGSWLYQAIHLSLPDKVVWRLHCWNQSVKNVRKQNMKFYQGK